MHHTSTGGGGNQKKNNVKGQQTLLREIFAAFEGFGVFVKKKCGILPFFQL